MCGSLVNCKTGQIIIFIKGAKFHEVGCALKVNCFTGSFFTRLVSLSINDFIFRREDTKRQRIVLTGGETIRLTF